MTARPTDETADATPPPRRSARGRTLFAFARNKRVARLVASGMHPRDIAKQIGLTRAHIYAIAKEPGFQEMVQDFVANNDTFVREGLLEGERSAINFMVNLVENESADEELRFKAAHTLLDRAGARGKPVERVESKSLQLSGDAAQAALANALRDPGVRSWLEANPQVAKALLQPAAPSESPAELPNPSPPSDVEPPDADPR